MARLDKITEHTLMPVSLIVVFASVIITVTMAMAKVDKIAENDAKQDKRIDQQIEKQDQKNEQMLSIMLEIRDRVIRLEAKSK